MSKFKIGDRVKVYTAVPNYAAISGNKATVTSMSCGFVTVLLDDSQKSFSAHEKQCRKLKPKKKPLAFETICTPEIVSDMANGGSRVKLGISGYDLHGFVGKTTKVKLEVIE